MRLKAIEIIEFHLSIEQQIYEKMQRSFKYSATETLNQYWIVKKLEQILQEIKEQENE